MPFLLDFVVSDLEALAPVFEVQVKLGEFIIKVGAVLAFSIGYKQIPWICLVYHSLKYLLEFALQEDLTLDVSGVLKCRLEQYEVVLIHHEIQLLQA